MALPERFSAEIDDPGYPYAVELEIAVRYGLPTCSRLVLSQRDGGEPVSSRGLRAVPLTRYLALATAQAALKAYPQVDGSVAYEPMWGEEVVRGPEDIEGPRPMSDEHLREVARIYREAVGRGSNAPRRAIEADPRWHASTATVGRWVQAARRRGFLRDAMPRRAGEARPGGDTK